MKIKQDLNSIKVEMTNEEALVFLDWLFRFNEGNHSDLFNDQAEERVLWNLEASLEKVISTVFEKNYSEILEKAREIVRDKNTR